MSLDISVVGFHHYRDLAVSVLARLGQNRRFPWVAMFLAAAGVISLGLVVFQTIHGGPFRKEVVIEASEIMESDGHGHRWRMPNRNHPLAMERHSFRRAVVYEDGARLGAVRTGRRQVWELGMGRYTVTNGGNLWFSTSDNSDPAENGRRYAVKISREPPTWLWWMAWTCLLLGAAGWMLTAKIQGRRAIVFQRLAGLGEMLPRTLSCRSALIVAVVAVCLVVTRMPHVLANASFWSEDANVFFAAAWEGGLRLFDPYAGYIHALPRLVAYCASFFPLEWQAALYLLAVLFVFFLICWYVASSTLPACLPWILPLSMAAAPHQGEVFQGICLLHYLLVPGLLVAALVPGSTPWRRLADGTIVAASGLSGPQILLLFPLFWATWWLGRRRGFPWLAVLATAFAACQLWALLGFAAHQRAAAAALSPEEMADAVVAGLLAPLFTGQQLALWFPVAAGVVGVVLGIVLASVVLVDRRTRLAALFLGFAAGAIGAAAMLSPTGGLNTFHVFAAGQRYWYVPAVVLTCFALMVACHYRRWWLWLPVAMICISSLANWQWPQISADLVWRDQVKTLRDEGEVVARWRPEWEMRIFLDPPGTEMIFPDLGEKAAPRPQR